MIRLSRSILSATSERTKYIIYDDSLISNQVPPKMSISTTLHEASGTPNLLIVPIPGESTSYDPTQEDGQENDIVADPSSAGYMPYSASGSLHATTSAVDAIFPSALPTNASFALASVPVDQLRLMPAAVIIGVVVGVVGMFIGLGLVLSYRRREKVELKGEGELDIEGVNRLSYESGDSYILQKARAQSVQFKKGVLISIPSRGRVASAVAGPPSELEQQ